MTKNRISENVKKMRSQEKSFSRVSSSYFKKKSVIALFVSVVASMKINRRHYFQSNPHINVKQFNCNSYNLLSTEE